MVSHSPGFSPLPAVSAAGFPAPRWPALPRRAVRIGGVAVTAGQAARDADALARAGGVAIRQVLAASGSPLAACDYRAALAPFREPGTGQQAVSRNGYGRGAAGRPAARTAFIAAIRAALDAAEREEPAAVFAAGLAAASAAFGSDAAYAAAMADAAVQVLRREHAARLRALLSAAVRQAVTACDGERHRGGFSCAAVSACGTGDCALAGPPLAGERMTVPAPPGGLPRPANHGTGRGFSVSAALAALEAAVPFSAAAAARTVRVAGSDCSRARDCVSPGVA